MPPKRKAEAPAEPVPEPEQEDSPSGSEEDSDDDDSGDSDDSYPEVSSEDEGEESPGEEDEHYENINVDFLFNNPGEGDYLGIKTLLTNYLDGDQWDVSGLADAIIKEVGCGHACRQLHHWQGFRAPAPGHTDRQMMWHLLQCNELHRVHIVVLCVLIAAACRRWLARW